MEFNSAVPGILNKGVEGGIDVVAYRPYPASKVVQLRSTRKVKSIYRALG